MRGQVRITKHEMNKGLSLSTLSQPSFNAQGPLPKKTAKDCTEPWRLNFKWEPPYRCMPLWILPRALLPYPNPNVAAVLPSQFLISQGCALSHVATWLDQLATASFPRPILNALERVAICDSDYVLYKYCSAGQGKLLKKPQDGKNTRSIKLLEQLGLCPVWILHRRLRLEGGSSCDRASSSFCIWLQGLAAGDSRRRQLHVVGRH